MMEEKKELVLKINAKGQNGLSKNQQLFNNLTRQIELLEHDLINEGAKLTKLMQLHAKKVYPLHPDIAHARLQLALTLDKATWTNKFTKKQTETICETILELCDDAFKVVEPDAEQEALYDKWSESSYREELEQDKSESKEEFTGFMNETFGVEVDMENFDESPEGFDRFQEEMKEQLERERQKQAYHDNKKSKKQLARENELKAEEELKNKSLRTIYIALAKILHPDTEPDAEKKAEKEELMKKVTVAYDQKDLPTLLRLEMEWVHETAEHLEKLTDAKLKIYISTLQQQVTDLESERAGLCYHPRYAQISDYAHLSEKYAMKRIAAEAKQLQGVFTELNNLITAFGKPSAKADIATFCNDFCQARAEEYDRNIWNDVQPY